MSLHIATFTHNGERGKEKAWTYRCDCGEVDSCRLRATTVEEHRRHAATEIGKRMKRFVSDMDVGANVVGGMVGPVQRLAAFDPVSGRVPPNRDLALCREVISTFAEDQHKTSGK